MCFSAQGTFHPTVCGRADYCVLVAAARDQWGTCFLGIYPPTSPFNNSSFFLHPSLETAALLLIFLWVFLGRGCLSVWRQVVTGYLTVPVLGKKLWNMEIMSFHWGKGGRKGLPSVCLSSDKHYCICSPFTTFWRARHGFTKGRRELGKWSCGFLPAFHWDGAFACCMAHWQQQFWSGLCLLANTSLQTGRGVVCLCLTGLFLNSFVPICCWYPNQVCLSISSRRKLPCCLWLGTGAASKTEAVLFAASQRLLEEVAGSLLALACDWCLHALALRDGGFTDPAMGGVWYKVLMASFTSIFCGIWYRDSG